MANCIDCGGIDVKQLLPALVEWDADNDCWGFRIEQIAAFTCSPIECNSEQEFWNLLARTIVCACDGRPALRYAISEFDETNTLTQVCNIQGEDIMSLMKKIFVKDVVSGELAISLYSLCTQK